MRERGWAQEGEQERASEIYEFHLCDTARVLQACVTCILHIAHTYLYAKAQGGDAGPDLLLNTFALLAIFVDNGHDSLFCQVQPLSRSTCKEEGREGEQGRDLSEGGKDPSAHNRWL